MRYRKKPIVISAFQMTQTRRRDNSEWPIWLHAAWQMEAHEPGSLFCVDEDGMVGPGDKLCITTLEGVHAVSWGDWIIQGVQGELYPCKPEIFDATYEAVE